MTDDIDDTFLTAYALGELPDDDRARVEAHLAHDPAARQFVHDIADTADVLRAALRTERVLDPRPSAHPRRLAIAAPAPARWYASRLTWTLAASILIVVGTYALVLPKLFRAATVERANQSPATQNNPDHSPILILPPGPLAQRPDLPPADVWAGAAPGLAPSAFVPVTDAPISPFPLSADARAYRAMRLLLADNQLPDPEAVRIESLVNAFTYTDPTPPPGLPLGGAVEIAACPWDESHRLAKIAIKAQDVPERPASVVAQDVSVHVTFDPQRVRSYRLLGYDHRQPEPPATAPDIRAGHAVTALYEMVPAPRSDTVPGAPPLTVHFSYTLPDAAGTRRHSLAATDLGARFHQASPDFRLAAAAAAFGLALRQPPDRRALDLPSVLAWIEEAVKASPAPDRQELLDMVTNAQRLSRQPDPK